MEVVDKRTKKEDWRRVIKENKKKTKKQKRRSILADMELNDD